MQSYGDYTFHGTARPRVTDETDEYPALDASTLPADDEFARRMANLNTTGELSDRPIHTPAYLWIELAAPAEFASHLPDPTDDGLGCSDGGEWRDADPDLWAFGACLVLSLLVLIAVWMFAAG